MRLYKLKEPFNIGMSYEFSYLSHDDDDDNSRGLMSFLRFNNHTYFVLSVIEFMEVRTTEPGHLQQQGGIKPGLSDCKSSILPPELARSYLYA